MDLEHDPYDLDAQAARTDARVRQDAREAREALEDLVWLMSGPRGRRIMWRIVRDSNLHASPFNANANVTAHEIGRGQLARGFRRLIEQACPEHWLTMLREHQPRLEVPAVVAP